MKIIWERSGDHAGNFLPLSKFSGKNHEKFVFEWCYLDDGDGADDDYVDGDDNDDDYVDSDDNDDGPRMACASDAIWRDTGWVDQRSVQSKPVGCSNAKH